LSFLIIKRISINGGKLSLREKNNNSIQIYPDRDLGIDLDLYFSQATPG